MAKCKQNGLLDKERSAEWNKGFVAYADNNASPDDNPYPEDSYEADEWEAGWRKADEDYGTFEWDANEEEEEDDE